LLPVYRAQPQREFFSQNQIFSEEVENFMAGRGSKPVQLIQLEGKSHRTKKELEHREKIEKSLYTGMNFKESPAVKKDPIAHKEFLRLKKLYKNIQYVEGLDEQIINRYCLLVSQENSLQEFISKKRSDEEVSVDDLIDLYKAINKTRDSLLKLEDRLFLNPTARVKAIPKTPEDDNKKSPMAEFLNRRAGGNHAN
jgi:P27 family predicted phage terminase small subunit